MKKYLKIIIAVFLIITIGGIISMKPNMLRGENNTEWEEFGKWYEWKIKTELPQHQREVIEYFQKVDEIMTKAKNTWWVNKNLQNPPPKKGIKIINDSINKLDKIRLPKECLKYHETNLKWLEIIKEYHEKRLETEDPNELEKIDIKVLSVDGVVFTERARILNEIGFMDNYEKEVVKLKK